MTQKILVVDDDPLTHRLFQHHLERAGYRMVSAMTGREAVEMATRELPQLIVTDIMMEDLDGLGALRQLKKTEATKEIPVIVITGSVNAHSASRREAQTSGAAGFLTKPLSPAQLLTEVRRVLPPPQANNPTGEPPKRAQPAVPAPDDKP